MLINLKTYLKGQTRTVLFKNIERWKVLLKIETRHKNIRI